MLAIITALVANKCKIEQSVCINYCSLKAGGSYGPDLVVIIMCNNVYAQLNHMHCTAQDNQSMHGVYRTGQSHARNGSCTQLDNHPILS